MRFGKADWRTAERGEERCFLLANGLGGYVSFSLTGANTRNDHALLMGVDRAPNCRYHYLTNLQETLETEGKQTDLSSQSYVAMTRNQHGHQYLEMFSYEDIPEWTYMADGITIQKQIAMAHEENTVAVHYQVWNPAKTQAVFRVCPLMKFRPKDGQPDENQEFWVEDGAIKSDGRCLSFRTNGSLHHLPKQYISDLYFAYDARDGRDAVGSVVKNHEIVFGISEEFCEFELVYSDKCPLPPASAVITKEKERQAALEEKAGFRNPYAVRLVKSADQFLVKRDSTNGDSIIAGYPFFSDWGRDTMIALLGCGIETRQYERVKSILRTFAAYCRKGIMPNLFPEGESEPMYNTADASLWFIEAVYEYHKRTNDKVFVDEMLPVMQDIVSWYRKGTDFHIFMDEDGLILAGGGLEQVTWMDVRIGEVLPTPRHGKPVEINALWYNALCILAEFAKERGQFSCENEYQNLAKRVKESFIAAFWMEDRGYLKDVIAAEDVKKESETQIRCNQVWALSLPYTMPEKEQAMRILQVIEKELYTPYGLRSLSMQDKEFHAFCRGSQWDRDISYHQGTVWGYPLGAYLLSILKWLEPQAGMAMVKQKLRMFETCMEEGCIGQVAEIYDGACPNESRGCFAQAWSVGEMLRVYREIEGQD